MFVFVFNAREPQFEFQVCHLLAFFAHLENDAVKIQLSSS